MLQRNSGTNRISKYPMAYLIKTKTAGGIAERLFDYIAMFGPPKTIISDQGKEFVNQVVKALLDLHGVEHRATSSYFPRSNGKIQPVFGAMLTEARRSRSQEMG